MGGGLVARDAAVCRGGGAAGATASRCSLASLGRGAARDVGARLDLHQAFVDVTIGMQPTLSLRAGRQELAFGSSRLVSVRESPNVRQSFDGLRALLRAGAWKVDGFVTLPVNTKRGVFDDDPDTQRLFWGGYVVHPVPLLPEGHIDLYYLGLNREEAHFDQGSAHEVRHTLGLRLWGRPSPWDYNVEVVYQLGTFGEGQLHAWTAASDTGYTLRPVAGQPRLGLKADIISGDRNPRDWDLHTFNPLFPKGAYFGEIALIGPANLIDVHPSLDLHPTAHLIVSADWDVFWRESLHDGLYGNAVNLLRSGQRSRARSIGSQASLQVEWQVERHTTLSPVYSHVVAGPFLAPDRTRAGRGLGLGVGHRQVLTRQGSSEKGTDDDPRHSCR